MKKYLLPKGMNAYKANLHCHTTISDGDYTPEEIKKHYMDNGYSIVAYTDHEILLPHQDLADANFLPLNGYEYEVLSPEKPNNPAHKLRKTCHMCLIALSPDNLEHVCWPEGLWGNAKKYRHLAKIKDEPVYQQVYGGECISHVMQTARNNGFFVTYNHPTWSMEDMADIQHYHGMHAMEIYNNGCRMSGHFEYNPTVYSDILRRGERIYCIAADDTHVQRDLCGGWTMIFAEKLEYRTVTKALVDGHFYASTGPQIEELFFEDGKIHLKCSPAQKIFAACGSRTTKKIVRGEQPLTEAVIPVEQDDIFIRLTIWDEDGNHADTNAYFTDELFAE